MPTKKRNKGARSAARRGAVRGAQRPKRGAAAARKKPAARKQAGGRAAARGAKASSARPKRPAATLKTRVVAVAAGVGRELAALKARFQREKSAFEKRLTDTVREIGQLRHHEARATQFERQLKERDETIAQLRTQLNNLRNRELVAADDEEVQPSLALGSRPAHDLDEFDEDVGAEDDDELI